MSGEPGIKRTGSHFDEMYTKFKELYKCDPSSLMNAMVFTDPEFSPALRHHYVPFNCCCTWYSWSSQKLLDRIPTKLLGKEEYTRFEEAFIIPLVGPRQ